MPNCIITGCHNDARNNFSVRCRRPDTTAIWAPNTEAFLCDDHAAQGLRIAITLTPNASGEIETEVTSQVGQAIRRTTIINQP